jgi:branched-chain amino acid transport system substrate-binding protein
VIGILKEMRSTSYNPKAVVVESPAGLREPFGDSLNGIYVPLLWDKGLIATKDPYIGTSVDFARLYKEKYGTDITDFVAAIGAHDLVAYALVMQKAGVIDDPAKITDAFSTFSGETFFGPVGFGDDGLNRKGSTLAGQFQNQVPVVVYPAKAALAKPIHPYPGAK